MCQPLIWGLPPPPNSQVLYWRLGWVGERSRRQAPSSPPDPPQTEDPPPFPPVVLTVGGDVRGALLGGLRPWSRYQLRVVVFNGRGDGPLSEPIAFQTPEGGERPPPKMGTPPPNGKKTPLLLGPPPQMGPPLLNWTPHPIGSPYWDPPPSNRTPPLLIGIPPLLE